MLGRGVKAKGTASQFDDSYLVAIYDEDNPDGEDHDFFRRLATATQAQSIVDLGCGTGILTVTLTGSGRSVIGIDPAPAMIKYAQHRPGAHCVEWQVGTSDQIMPHSADLVIMSGNVAMHMIGDQWYKALKHIAHGLKLGGRLAFETRNPENRAWERWSHEQTTRKTVIGRLNETTVIEPPDQQGVVVMRSHREFLESGYMVDTVQRLQFRSYEQITEALEQAGLRVERCYRSWSCEPFTGGEDQPLMIFTAAKY
ncbi:class I SAM-dependent methyltransferase [Rothia sp. P5766]|uniref:class I SAM-dependent methyltransferase n=1 Tax=Rothia sp. P5766 TaxID=3402656 RepID=UPI003ADAF901